MPSGMVIKDAELRGVASSGMICSMKELNLPNAPEEKGIMVLNDSYEIGQAFLNIKEGSENMSWFDKLFGEDNDSNDDLIHRRKKRRQESQNIDNDHDSLLPQNNDIL